MARTASVSVRMEQGLREALEAKAAAEGGTLAGVMRRALRDSLTKDLGQMPLPIGECAHPMSHRYRDTCLLCRAKVEGPRQVA